MKADKWKRPKVVCANMLVILIFSLCVTYTCENGLPGLVDPCTTFQKAFATRRFCNGCMDLQKNTFQYKMLYMLMAEVAWVFFVL